MTLLKVVSIRINRTTGSTMGSIDPTVATSAAQAVFHNSYASALIEVQELVQIIQVGQLNSSRSEKLYSRVLEAFV